MCASGSSDIEAMNAKRPDQNLKHLSTFRPLFHVVNNKSLTFPNGLVVLLKLKALNSFKSWQMPHMTFQKLLRCSGCRICDISSHSAFYLYRYGRAKWNITVNILPFLFKNFAWKQNEMPRIPVPMAAEEDENAKCLEMAAAGKIHYVIISTGGQFLATFSDWFWGDSMMFALSGNFLFFETIMVRHYTSNGPKKYIKASKCHI